MRSHSPTSSANSPGGVNHPFAFARQAVDQLKQIGFAFTSTPLVGSSNINTLASLRSHLPMATFCWLPPERRRKTLPGTAGANADAGDHLLRPAPRLTMAEQAPAREAVIGADGKVHAHRLVDKNALFAPLFRHQRQARAAPSPPGRAAARADDSAHRAPRGFCWRQTAPLQSSVLPAPASPAIPRISPLRRCRGDIFSAARRRADLLPAGASLCRAAGARAGVDIAQHVAEHLLNDRFTAKIGHRSRLNQLAVAQHREGVADGLQLVNAVGDKHHADALLL